MGRKTHDIDITRSINNSRIIFTLDKKTKEFTTHFDNDYRKIRTLADTIESYSYSQGESKQLRRHNRQFSSKRKVNNKGKGVK